MDRGRTVRRVGPTAAALLAVALAGCTGREGGEGGAPPVPAAPPPHLTGHSAPLAPGTYRLSFVAAPGVTSPDSLVDLPAGFVEGEGGDDWYVVSDDGEEFLGLWVIEQVDHDACRREDTDAFDPGPSVADLADALVAQRSTRATPPRPVTLAGRRGLYVELTGPPDLDACGRFPGLWRAPERGLYVDGQVDQVWILDVGGQRLAVDASYSPSTPTSERERLTTMVESLEFVGAG